MTQFDPSCPCFEVDVPISNPHGLELLPLKDGNKKLAQAVLAIRDTHPTAEGNHLFTRINIRGLRVEDLLLLREQIDELLKTRQFQDEKERLDVIDILDGNQPVR